MIGAPAALGQSATPEAPGAELFGDEGAESAEEEEQTGPERSEVAIRVAQFGVGDALRPGDYFGLRLQLADTRAEARNVVLRLHIPDPDGDTVLQQVWRGLTPGNYEDFWVYGLLPPDFQKGDYFTVTVHEMDGDDPENGVGRRIASTRIEAGGRQNNQVQVYSTLDNRGSVDRLIGIIHEDISQRKRVRGLEQYTNPSLFLQDTIVTQHQPIKLRSGLDPMRLPDRWMGLAPYEVLIVNQVSPSEFDDARGSALREWVQRGGHLIVLLRHPGQAWFGTPHGLADLVPRATLLTINDADLEEYRDLLTTKSLKERDEPFPKPVPLFAFSADPDAERAEAIPLLSGPDGCVVMRRLVGAGMVTFVGLQTEAAGSHLRADAFWHRLLGNRFSVPDPKRDERGNLERYEVRGTPDQTVADRDIATEIARSRTAGLGVLLALVIFGLYWVIAGPGGFAFLKAYHWARHAWIFFVGISLVFTAVAWMGATLMRPSLITGSHLTLYDHVYGQDVDRARMWVGVLLPRYGDQSVRVGTDEDDTELHQSIQPWANPLELENHAFPDARAYAIASNRPDRVRVPTRSTMKQFQVDWAGPMMDGMLAPNPDNPPRIDKDGRLQGAFSHSFEGELHDVRIIYVRGQLSSEDWKRQRNQDRTGILLADSWAWQLGQTLGPDVEFDFEDPDRDIRYSSQARFERLSRVLTQAIRGGLIDNTTSSSAGSPGDVYAALSLHSVLQPPDFVETGPDAIRKRVMTRGTHGWDLGKWFTQPCLIVIGQLEGHAGPIPMSVDGRPLQNEGRTVVRWIYPLEPNPPVFSGDAEDGDDRDDQSM